MIQRFASRVRSLLARRSRAVRRARTEFEDREMDSTIDPYQLPCMAVIA
jgi:hypothetical protein